MYLLRVVDEEGTVYTQKFLNNPIQQGVKARKEVFLVRLFY